MLRGYESAAVDWYDGTVRIASDLLLIMVTEHEVVSAWLLPYKSCSMDDRMAQPMQVGQTSEILVPMPNLRFVALSLVVAAGCTQEPVSQGVLAVSPDSLTIEVAVGTTATQAMTIHVGNLGAGELLWVARLKDASPWLTLQSDSGVAGIDSILLVAHPGGLALGVYRDSVIVSSTTVSEAVTVPVAFNIVAPAPAAPNKLSFTPQPSSASAGTNQVVQVRALDSLGNTVSAFTHNVTLTSTADTNWSMTVAAVTGVATFSSVAIDRAGCQQLIASSRGLQPDTSATFCVTPGPPAALAFSVQPTPPNLTCTGTGIGLPVQVTILDTFANVVVSATNQVQIALGNNPAGASLSGITTVGAVAGVATFSNLSIDKVGSGYTLVATAAGLTSATSPPFNVPTDVCFDLLVFTVQPSNAAPGAVIAPPIQVCARNESGNIDTSFVGNVTIGIGSNPGGGTFSGTTTIAAVAGCVTFSDLSIDKAGTGYTLAASSPGLSSATSVSFNIGP